GDLAPALGRESASNQRTQQPPGARRPFDLTLVHVMPPWSRMIAPARKSKLESRHGKLLMIRGLVGIGLVARVVILVFGLLGLLQIVLERDGGVGHEALAVLNGRLHGVRARIVTASRSP